MHRSIPDCKAGVKDEAYGPIGSDRSGRNGMAKLIVTRPRLGSSWDIKDRFDVLIDGSPNAPIGLGETIVIELSPGRHLVGARFATSGSQPILVESAPGETHRLAVGTNVGLGRLESWALILALLPLFGLVVWELIDTISLLQHTSPLLQGAQRAIASFPGNWHDSLQMALIVPALFLASMGTQAHLAFVRNDALVVTEVPDPNMTVEQIAILLRERPFRVRITIRQLMIAVAISAIGFCISLEVFRNSRTSEFRSAANLHAALEKIFRGTNAAKADYHATLRRKYEHAVASRSFSVDPDPSAPP
jgi:hypothetical protein